MEKIFKKVRGWDFFPNDLGELKRDLENLISKEDLSAEVREEEVSKETIEEKIEKGEEVRLNPGKVIEVEVPGNLKGRYGPRDVIIKHFRPPEKLERSAEIIVDFTAERYWLTACTIGFGAYRG